VASGDRWRFRSNHETGLKMNRSRYRSGVFGLLLVALAGIPPLPAEAQQLTRPVVGAGVGVAGGAVITLSAIVYRARFQREYIDSVDDLIHWQTLPMILAPAAGVTFGLAGQDALMGSIVGSTSGMLVGAASGAGLGLLLSSEPEWPWAGGVIGAGLGMSLGGLALGFHRWAEDEDPDVDFPTILRFNITLPIQ
ncbi:MAG: glycine zipper 2TM domain-containing protein, partial [Gemmatimonadota bacterium]